MVGAGVTHTYLSAGSESREAQLIQRLTGALQNLIAQTSDPGAEAMGAVWEGQQYRPVATSTVSYPAAVDRAAQVIHAQLNCGTDPDAACDLCRVVARAVLASLADLTSQKGGE